MLDTLLFDLDGTLVPFVQDEFIAAYFRALVTRVAPLGYQGEQVVGALWKGTGAMLKNDGKEKNCRVFWDVFARLLGEEVRSLEPALEQFYTEEFNAVRAILRERRELSSLMGSLREKGYTLVLATNPIFPAVAVATRMSWVGLAPEDFDYVTTYENSTYSKPDPAYYREILEKVEKKPEQCLMVGNNPTDDGAAALLGMELRIVTDYLENERGLDLGPFICRTFREMEEELLTLPSVK